MEETEVVVKDMPTSHAMDLIALMGYSLRNVGTISRPDFIILCNDFSGRNPGH
jgi:hypothetical protein